MSLSFTPLQAFALPNLELMIICVFAASLPVAFVLWLRAWLGSVKEENPDDVLKAQAEADREHLSGHGGGHGSGHGHGHSSMHAHGSNPARSQGSETKHRQVVA